jgi:hypothetical protein
MMKKRKRRTKIMDNIIWKELSEDDPIFKTGFVLSSPNLQTGLKQLVKQGWTITDDETVEEKDNG